MQNIKAVVDLNSRIESALAGFLNRNFDQTNRSVVPNLLEQSIRYSTLSGGKRIRPRLSLATSKLLGLNESIGLRAGIAVELIHTFTLIHDDLPCMDNDDLRRGKPSNHIAYGEPIALLAGDALIPMAYQCLTEVRKDVSAEYFANALTRFGDSIGVHGVIGGQAFELSLESNSTLDQLAVLHSKKTGALFEASILLPMDLSGVSEFAHQGQILLRLSQSIGSAFQLLDDFDDQLEDNPKQNLVIRDQKLEYTSRVLAKLKECEFELDHEWGPKKSADLFQISHSLIQKLDEEISKRQS